MPTGAAGVYPSRPPEVNSGTIESGVGSATWAAAASAFGAFASVAASLGAAYLAAAGEEVALRGGMTSLALAGQSPPYMIWVSTVEAQLAAKAAASSAAAAAFEGTRGGVVPVPAINANRLAEANAQATNFLGVNTGLIAQLDALYTGMWTHDGSMLVNYDTAMNLFTTPTPIPPPPPIGNEAKAVASTVEQGTQSAIMTGMQSGSQATGKTASQTTQQLGQSLNSGSGMESVGSLASAATSPLSSVSSLPQSLMSLPQSVLSPFSSALGQLGQLGASPTAFGPSPSTGFGTASPVHSGLGGLGVGGAGLGSGGSGLGAGGAGLGGGGVGGMNPGLNANGGAENRSKRMTVFSGIPQTETIGSGRSATGAGGMPMGGSHGAGKGGGDARRTPTETYAAETSDDELNETETLSVEQRARLFA